MKALLGRGLMWGLLMGMSGGLGAEGSPLHPQLESFRSLLGKTWVGDFPPSPRGEKVTDVVRYERALNGNAVRSLHSLNDGVYGGETLFRWDERTGQLVFHYFTTQGFLTQGTLVEEPTGTFTSREVVDDPDAAGGVSEVRSVFTVAPDKLEVSSSFLKNGQWEPGHRATYHLAPDREVVFQ